MSVGHLDWVPRRLPDVGSRRLHGYAVTGRMHVARGEPPTSDGSLRATSSPQSLPPSSATSFGLVQMLVL